jgi:hypothetical protein
VIPKEDERSILIESLGMSSASMRKVLGGGYESSASRHEFPKSQASSRQGTYFRIKGMSVIVNYKFIARILYSI